MTDKKFDVFDPTKTTATQEVTPTENKQAELEKQKEYIAILKSRLKDKRLMIATPMYGGQCHGSYTYSCINLAMLCQQFGVPVQFRYLFNESLIQRARNFLVDEFYHSDATHLLFIDSDISFDARDAIVLLSLCGVEEEGKPRYDVITGTYPKKAIAWEKVLDAAKSGIADSNPMILSKFVGDFAFNPIAKTGKFELNLPLEVAEGATGFMCMGKDVIEKFRKKYPKQKYKPDHARSATMDGSRPVYAVFDCGIDPESNRYFSEDYWFSQKCREIGLHIWLCPWMSLQHTGSYTFGGSIVDHAQLGKPINPSGISPEHIENIKRELKKK